MRRRLTGSLRARLLWFLLAAIVLAASAQALGISQPAVTRILSRLVALGLVETSRAHRDQRQKTIALAAEGEAVMARVKAVLWPMIASAVADLCGDAPEILLDQVAAIERALAEAGPPPATVPPTHDDIGMVMYTSGTTGHPKGAIITHGMVFWNCVNLGIPALITPETVQLVVLPLFHTGGLNCYANPVLHAGGTIVIVRNFDPGQALDCISDLALGITHFFAVPAPYQFMMQHPKFQGADLSVHRISSTPERESNW
eukprot:gene39631-52272_t